MPFLMSHEGVFHRGSKLAKSKKSVPHHLCGLATIPLKDLLCLFEINQENTDEVTHLLNVPLFYLKTPQVYELNEALAQWRTSASSTFVMGVIIAVAICIYYSQPSSRYTSSWEGRRRQQIELYLHFAVGSA